MAEKGAVTLEDVAREAGVSISTASRTLNGRGGRVGEATQARVRAVASRLGYATNLAAQAVALGRSRSIGLIVSEVPDDYQNPVMTGVFRAAAARGMLVTTAVSRTADAEASSTAVRLLRGQRPSAIIYVGTESPTSAGMPELIRELQHADAEGCRVVLIGVSGTPLDSVVVDDKLAAAELAVALEAIGYRDPLVVAGGGLGQISQDRTDGFIDGYAGRGITVPPHRVIVQASNHDGGYRAGGEILRRLPRPDVVFCVNDAMAIGLCVRLREQGLVVGKDIAVAGCDDIPALRDIDPPLSTISMPWLKAGEEALRLADDEQSSGRTVVLEGYPLLRASTPGLAG
ncbi:MAG TPA: LacI family DNA-binding transcriptional regulator [Arachnia sp.]|nr:LacI family DNA-binding transcriptional regulator [Arachnia sp.]HMT87109.1 LacI family DNA-binding transcriptional regulator [Arachnia sp.]